MTLTKVLVAINVLVYLCELVTGGPVDGRLVEAGILKGPAVEQVHEWYRIVTSAFLHASIPHVALNMVALYQVGSLVERLMGTARYAIVYAAALLGSSFAVLTFNYDVSTLGASGAIFGLFGALVAIGLSLPPRGMSLVTQTLPIIGINLAFGFAVPGISNAAHIGGLITGFVVGYGIYLIPSERRIAVNAAINAPVPVAAAVAAAPEAAQAVGNSGGSDREREPMYSAARPGELAAYAHEAAAPGEIETIEHPPEGGPHESADAPPLEERDPSDR